VKCTGTMAVWPPHSSGSSPASLSSCRTRSMLAPSLSICAAKKAHAAACQARGRLD
jgi:hypothetical protein